MSDNLLIVFGGTTQSELQDVFTPTELEQDSTDILQFNLLTVESNVTLCLKNHSYQSQELIKAEPGSILQLRALESEVNQEALEIYGYQGIQPELEAIGNAIEKVNWSATNYSENSDARGMTQEACHLFSSTSQALILSFLEKIGQNYKNIFIMAHSRGCSLAINTLCDIQNSNFNISNNALTDKLKRIVLLDPVAKNVGFNDFIIEDNVKIINNLSRYPRNIEIHFVVKTQSSNYDYQSFVDRLVGTKLGTKVNKEASLDKHNLSGHNSNIPNLKNIYVHLAHMVHEGMLGNDLTKHFKKYKKIISGDDWTEMYSNNQLIEINHLINSDALNRYIDGKESANNINPEEGDGIHDLFYSFQIGDIKSTLKDRRRAFIHCLAGKVYALQ